MDMMVDLETLSLKPGAATMQIGWAVFDPDGSDVEAHGCIRVDTQDCMNLGMYVDWSAIAWWLGRSDEARRDVVEPGAPVVEAVREFVRIFKRHQVKHIWAKSLGLDIGTINVMLSIAKLKEPWYYRDVRCMRTFLAEWPVEDKPDEDKAHTGEDDAIDQAQRVQRGYAVKREKTGLYEEG